MNRDVDAEMGVELQGAQSRQRDRDRDNKDKDKDKERPMVRGDSLEDLLKFAANDSPSRPQTSHSSHNTHAHTHAHSQESPSPQQRRRGEDKIASFAADDENLGENFQVTPWLPPDVKKAQAFRRDALFRNGDVRVDAVEIVHAPDLGSGVTLYFEFARSMSICLFVMSLLALPELVFVYYGSAIAPQYQDALGLFRYTLGNLGYDKEAQNYANVSRCLSGGYAANDVCIRIGSGVSEEFSLSDATNIITAMEFLQVFVFLAGVLFLRRRAFAAAGKASRSDVSLSDYAVIVEDIPPDASDAELVEHFSRLYALDKVDFKRRPALRDARPVPRLPTLRSHSHSHANLHAQHTQTQQALCAGTWVAECTVHKAVGSFVSQFKSQQHVMQKLYRARAKMKMYAENSPHSHGHDLNRFRVAEKQVVATSAVIERLTTQLQKTGLTLINENAEDGLSPEAGDNFDGNSHPASPNFGDKTPGKKSQLENNFSSISAYSAGPTSSVSAKKRLVSDPSSVYFNIDAPAVCAFVVFEYAESFARCVEDYEKYSHFPYSLSFLSFSYPQELKLRGTHKMTVRRAPEPDQIVWEHLEVSRSKARYLRTRTALLTLALVIVCFVITLQASIYKAYFSAKVPDSSLCATTVPELYTNRSVSPQKVQLVRPPRSLTAQLDAQCAALSSQGPFYAIYALDGDFDRPVANYSFSACWTSSSTSLSASSYGSTSLSLSPLATTTAETRPDFCPKFGASSFCPCVSTASTAQCLSADCPQKDDGSVCLSFEAQTIGACFCYSELERLILDSGVAQAAQRVRDLTNGECGDFFEQYSIASALTYVSVATTTIVNVLLRTVLKKLATQEARTSSDAVQGSIMSKIFLSNFATMAVIVLVAYGRFEGLPRIFKVLHIFNGPYDDFSVQWYAAIGFYLTTTFIVQSFSPLGWNIVSYYLIKPLLRFYHHKQVREMKSHSIVMQHDLDMLEVGPVFDSTDHTAQLLTLLFFTMLYAPGLPLLMPLCAFAFALYFRVDKFLLCRYYQKPPHMGDAAMRAVIAYLPLAAVLRLAFACWMFSNRNILTTMSSPNTKAYESFLEGIRSSAALPVAQDRLFRPNVFPLFVFFLAICAGILINHFWRQLPVFWLYKLAQFCCYSAAKIQHSLMDDDEDSGFVDSWSLLKKEDPLRRQCAPFSGEFFRYVKHKDEIPDTCLQMFEYAYLTQLNETEVEEGWGMEDRGDFVVLVKEFTTDNVKRYDGSRVRKGDKKLTFEVIADHRCNTYDIEKVPDYRLAIQGMREGILSKLEGDPAAQAQSELDLELGEQAAMLMKKKPSQSHSLQERRAKNLTIAVDNASDRDSSTIVSPGAPSTTKSASHVHTQAQANRNFTMDDFLQGNEEIFNAPSADEANTHTPGEQRKRTKGKRNKARQ